MQHNTIIQYNATQYNTVQHNTQKGIIGGSCHKYYFCCDKCVVYAFVVTKQVFCCDKSMLVVTCDKTCLLL